MDFCWPVVSVIFQAISPNAALIQCHSFGNGIIAIVYEGAVLKFMLDRTDLSLVVGTGLYGC
jgi:hypothetical protein